MQLYWINIVAWFFDNIKVERAMGVISILLITYLVLLTRIKIAGVPVWDVMGWLGKIK